jgi:ribosomal protein L4
VIYEGEARNLRLASRNLTGIKLTTGRELNTYQVLECHKLLFTRPAFAQVEQRLR